jgi:hypothetical protein
VVILFYVRDLCKMKLTAKSISQHDPDGLLGHVLLLWLDESLATDHAEDIDEIKAAIEQTRRVTFHDFSWMIRTKGMAGWKQQQMMKLKAATLIETDFYVVLDAKNAIIRDVRPGTLISACNTGFIFGQHTVGELTEEKRGWFEKSAKALGVTVPPDRKLSGSTTPVLMHTQTVRDMFQAIGEKMDTKDLCMGPLCDFIHDGATEFTMYELFVATRSEEGCIHTLTSRSLARNLWNGCTVERRVQTIEEALADEDVIFFGAQPGTLDGLSPDEHSRLAKSVSGLYSLAGLYDSSQQSEESLLRCLAAPG